MKLLLTLSILLLTCDAFAQNTIRLNISANGYPPYLIRNADSNASGIIVDLLRVVAHKQKLKIKTVNFPQKRIHKNILSDAIDVTPSAIEWVENADDYAFSDVILTVNDILFSPIDKPISFDVYDDLLSKKLGTRLGFNYPSLEPYFAKKLITKTEVSTGLAMLKVTLKNRIDASILEDRVGKWVIKSNPDLHNKFYLSKKAVNSFEYRLMFSKKWQPFIAVFNEELAQMKKSGEFDSILEQYE